MMALNRKHLLFVLAGLVALLSGSYYFFLIGPVLEKRQKVERAIERRERDLEVMAGLQKKWAALKEREAAANRILGHGEAGFNMLSFLEEVSREAGVSDKILHMKPISFTDTLDGLRREGMEISLEGVNVPEVTRYLYGIEYAEGLINVRRVRIQRQSERKSASSLKVTIQVVAYLPGPSQEKGL